MGKTAIEKNKEYSEKYVQKISSGKMSDNIQKIIKNNDVNSIIDMGCGDGGFICSAKKYFPEIKIVGVDISERRINALKKRFPLNKFYCGDVCDMKIKEKFDFVYSTQVIEHVQDDKIMVNEISNLLKKNGVLFLSSVMKKSWAIYRYRNNGNFVLDPTHEREYKNEKEFLNLFEKDFELIKFVKRPLKMPKFGLAIRIPGYYVLEGIWKKR